MLTCQASVVIFSLLMALMVGGCASHSASNDPSSATAGYDRAGAGSTNPRDGMGTPSQDYARPRLSDFVAHPDLRDVHFDFDSYQIRPADAKVLEASLQWLRTHPEALVVIEGHTDERGTGEYNVTLGERRAKASMNYLVSRGVQASRITVMSFGEERGACREHSESCWSRNRRAHFLVHAK
jgi:peptidoglycan-associated lipoprotein